MSPAAPLSYVLHTVLLLGPAWLFYRLLLRRERGFGFNRAFLVGAVVLAAAAPLLP